jgi:intein/homing endonuclease
MNENQLRLPSGKVITFNDEQFEGLKKIKHWTKNGETFFTLAGYAGTGKSTIVKKVLDDYRYGVVVSAPTHKAKKVIMNTTGEDGQTLHALLGLRPDVDLDNFNPNNPKFNPIAIPKISDYNLVIIDEASMINQELYDLITDKTLHTRTKVLFMGDPAQIPPVGEKVSVVFEQNNKEFHQLTKIERQDDGNPLINFYTPLRDNLTTLDGGIKRVSVINERGEGIIFTVNKREFREKVLESFQSEEFKKDTDYAKVIAWKNDTVMASNAVIREQLLGKDTDIIEVGDILMGYRSISDEKQRYNIIENSADYRVTKKGVLEENSYGITGWQVQFREDLAKGQFKHENVFIMDANNHDNLHLYAEMHDFFRDMGKSNKKNWKKYYAFRRSNILMKTIEHYRNGLYRSSGDIIVKDLDYGYAITGHKCLSEDSDILTDKGNIKLKEIKIGDNVSIGSGKYKPVINKFDSGVKKSFELITKSGYKIRCSEDHRILDSHNKFKPLKEFGVGEYIPINRNEFRKHVIQSKDINYFLGLLVADGSYAGNRKRDPYRIDLTIGLDDGENIDFIEEFYFENNVKYGVSRKKNSNCIQYYNSGKVWRTKLHELGLDYVKGEMKSTPTSILKGTYQMKSNFMAGLFDGDGHISKKRGRIILVNNSKKLLLEVQGMLLEFGIISYIRKEKKSYRITIVGTSVGVFRKHISFRLKRKRDVLDKYYPTTKTNIDFIPNKEEIFEIVKSDLKQKNVFLEKNKGLNPVDFKRFPNHVKHLSYENLRDIIQLYEFNNYPLNKRILEIFETYYYYDEIIAIESVGEEQMYDLEIEHIHRYVADGFIVHNSQGSTYSHVFVMENDINANWVLKERNQIKYVALTRPSISATVLTTKLD